MVQITKQDADGSSRTPDGLAEGAEEGKKPHPVEIGGKFFCEGKDPKVDVDLAALKKIVASEATHLQWAK